MPIFLTELEVVADSFCVTRICVGARVTAAASVAEFGEHSLLMHLRTVVLSCAYFPGYSSPFRPIRVALRCVAFGFEFGHAVERPRCVATPASAHLPFIGSVAKWFSAARAAPAQALCAVGAVPMVGRNPDITN